MQNQTKNAKKKTPMVFKPYLKGNLLDGAAVKRGLRLMAYYLMFVFLYLIVGTQTEHAFRVRLTPFLGYPHYYDQLYIYF